jgi:hypothetical protein
MAKKRTELTREECTTEALRREYSRQQYDKSQALTELESLDLITHFPLLETQAWHGVEYWMTAAREDEEKQRASRTEKRKLKKLSKS